MHVITLCMPKRVNGFSTFHYRATSIVLLGLTQNKKMLFSSFLIVKKERKFTFYKHQLDISVCLSLIIAYSVRNAIN